MESEDKIRAALCSIGVLALYIWSRAGTSDERKFVEWYDQDQFRAVTFMAALVLTFVYCGWAGEKHRALEQERAEKLRVQSENMELRRKQ